MRFILWEITTVVPTSLSSHAITGRILSKTFFRRVWSASLAAQSAQLNFCKISSSLSLKEEFKGVSGVCVFVIKEKSCP